MSALASWIGGPGPAEQMCAVAGATLACCGLSKKLVVGCAHALASCPLAAPAPRSPAPPASYGPPNSGMTQAIQRCLVSKDPDMVGRG